MTEKPQGYEDEWVVERRDSLGANWRRAPFVWPKDVAALNRAYGPVSDPAVRPVERLASAAPRMTAPAVTPDLTLSDDLPCRDCGCPAHTSRQSRFGFDWQLCNEHEWDGLTTPCTCRT